MLTCGNVAGSITESFANAERNSQTGRYEATFSCGEAYASCRTHDRANKTVNDGTVAWDGVKSVCETTVGVVPVCGNGVVESGEQCDLGTANNADPQYSCNSQCKIPNISSSSSSSSSSSGVPPSCVDDDSCVLTFPNDGEIIFGPKGHYIVGDNIRILETKGEVPYIYNNSEYDLSFDELCTTTVQNRTVFGGSISNPANVLNDTTRCMNLNNHYDGIIYPGERIEFTNYPTYTSNKSGIASGEDYGTETIATTIKDDGVLYDRAYFAGNLDVRVARPAVATVG